MSRIGMLRQGKHPDRVPIALSLSSYAPKMLEISAEDFYLNPEIAFEANCWLEEMFPADSEIGYTVPDSICMDFGGEVYFGKGSLECPKSVRIPARTEEELLKLKVPDPYTAPGASREFKYAKIRRRHGLRGAGMALSSPFRQSVEIIGMENLMRWMRRKPELVHYTCELIEEYSMKKAKMYVKEFGAEELSNAFSYPMESHELISPDSFKKFSAPHALALHQKLIEIGVNSFSEHLCGNHRHNLWFWREDLPLPEHTMITVGTELPLKEVSEGIGDRHILGGNVDTTILHLGTPREVYLESKRIIEEMKYRKGGFVLAAACVISTAIPPANITAMTASLLMGCGSSDSAEDEGTESTESEESTELEDKVVVYTAHPEEMLDLIIEGFTEETGIEVECLNVGGDLAERVRSEKDNPQADVIYGQDTATYMALKDEGCLAPSSPSWADELDDFFKDSEGYWYGTIKTPVMMFYNTEIMTEEEAPIGISTLNDIYDNVINNGLPLKEIYSESGEVVLCDCAGVINDCANPNAAAFLEYVGSPEVQAQIANEFFRVPTLDSALVDSPEWMANEIKTMEVDWVNIGEHKADWIKKWVNEYMNAEIVAEQ